MADTSERLLKVSEFLLNQKGEKGVSTTKGVRKDGTGNSDRVNPVLSSQERSRYTAIFTILKSVIFPPKEAERLTGTKVGKVARAEKLATVEKNKSNSNFPWKLLAGLGIFAAAAALFDKLGAVGRFITKILFNVKKLGVIFEGLSTALKWAWKTIKESKLIRTIMDFFSEFKLKFVDGIKNFFKENKLVQDFLEIIGIGGKESKIGAKVATKEGGLLSGLLGGVAKKVGSKLLKVLKFLPFIGGIVGLGFAYARFNSGDFLGGTLELISAILDFTGVGTVLSIAIDGFLVLRDMFNDQNKERAALGLPQVGVLDWLKETVGSKLMAALPYLPVIGGFYRLGEAWSAFKSGNTVEGLKLLGTTMAAFIGGKGLADGVLTGINWVIDMISGGSSEAQEVATVDSGESWVDILKNVWSEAGRIVGDQLKKLKDWALETLNPLNWFEGGDDVGRLKSEAESLTNQQKLNRARAAGWSDWEEYKSSGWQWRADKKTDTLSADTLNITKELSNLNKEQRDILNSINIGIQELIKKTMGNVNVTSSGGQQSAPSVYKEAESFKGSAGVPNLQPTH